MGQAGRKKLTQGERGTTSHFIIHLRRPFAFGFAVQPSVVLPVLTLLATLVYSNTFSVPFQFDDHFYIAENTKIKDLRNFLNFSGTRYVGLLSFALNYAVGGLNVLGYHVVNLVLHIANAFLVYGLVRLLFRTSGLQNATLPFVIQPAWIALATALLFVVHPIQTQAVTYISQRFASLATLFYLLAVVCYLQSRLAAPGAKRQVLWYGAALLSTVFAMKTKEISFTLPLMLMLVEVVFFRPITRTRWLSLLPFLLMLVIIPLSRIDAVWGPRGHQTDVGFARETLKMSRSIYLFTQFRVIVTYLRLLVWPANQNVLYHYLWSYSLLEPPVLISFLFLACLFGVAVLLLVRAYRSPYRAPFLLIAFGTLWFFLTLSIESSIVPIQDVIYEHRLYLPSTGFFVAGLTGALWGLEALGSRVWGNGVGARRSRLTAAAVMFCLMLVLLSIATYRRNAVWRDEVTLWEDVVRKSPLMRGAHQDLANVYNRHGRSEAAIREAQIALTFEPTNGYLHHELGTAYDNLGRPEEALRAYQMAVALAPGDATLHYNLGQTYLKLHRWEEAIPEFQAALTVKPAFAAAEMNLGAAYANVGRLEEAIRAFQRAVTIDPGAVQAYHNLGNAYAALGRSDEALRAYQAAVALEPDKAELHHELGIAYAKQGRWNEAVREIQAATTLAPTDADAYNNLGNAYAHQERWKEAIQAYLKALTLQPGSFETHYNLGRAYHRTGRILEATKEFQQTLSIKPDFLPARQALEALAR